MQASLFTTHMRPNKHLTLLRFGSDDPKPPDIKANENNNTPQGDTFTTCQTAEYHFTCQRRCFECDRGKKAKKPDVLSRIEKHYRAMHKPS